MGLGIVLVIVSIIAMAFPFYSTAFFAVVIGVLLVVAGVVGILVMNVARPRNPAVPAVSPWRHL